MKKIMLALSILVKEVFNKTEHFENMLIAENDLIDAYVKGDLSSEDQKRFENRLLLNPQQQQRVKFAKTLIKYVSSLPVEDLETLPSDSKWSSIFSRVFSLGPMLSFSYAAGALILFIGILWLVVDNNSPHFSHPGDLIAAGSPSNTDPVNSLDNTRSEEQKSANEVNPENKNEKNARPSAESSSPAGSQSLPKSRVEKPERPTPVFLTITLSLAIR